MNRISAIPGLDARQYRPSSFHAADRIWQEKNCYVDIWIEVLHALDLNVAAVLPFTLAIDFEGDQWTFFKPPHDEIRLLYGLDVQELNVWRPLLDHVMEHLNAGKLISTEADAFWLPDTAGTDYRRQHTKTTIVIAEIDPTASVLGYFHNAGYYMLAGEDFEHLFRIGAEPDPQFMPLFAEVIRLDRMHRSAETRLASISLDLLRRHLARRPPNNPITRFRHRFESDLPQLQQSGLAYYHAWAFSTVRQLGAAFELAQMYLRWLNSLIPLSCEPAVEAFGAIATESKTLILKAARAVHAKRAFDAGAAFHKMESAWEEGMAVLERASAI